MANKADLEDLEIAELEVLRLQAQAVSMKRQRDVLLNCLVRREETCNRCGQPGHFYRDCPLSVAEGRRLKRHDHRARRPAPVQSPAAKLIQEAVRLAYKDGYAVAPPSGSAGSDGAAGGSAGSDSAASGAVPPA
eukprot:gnl/Hemi2/22001_TR7340_c0_g1_i1.p1 gnl/Hemi2/22001_TR7340_c0_g1~~gnl/Hemi2/22001_TR7340_c0_g1_i1.p1  ORF type:complete len:144 (+),score=46.77 gnl/Hemi2/22001_TR7340_c0_g1_i1:32-433(+)